MKKDEGETRKLAIGCGKMLHADAMGKGVVADRKKLDAKYGRAAAEFFSRMNAEELQREREAHAQTAAEACADIAVLSQEVETARMWQRYEKRKRRKAEDERRNIEQALIDLAAKREQDGHRQRCDKGGKHRKTPRGWKSQREVAADFSRSEKKIRGKWYGRVTVRLVKDWESRYPDETKRERKGGYHAGMRNTANPTPEIKNAYFEAAAKWNDYWKTHNAAFLAWLKKNPNGDHGTFLKTWERPGKTVHRNDTDKTKRYGEDTSLSDWLDSGDFDGEA